MEIVKQSSQTINIDANDVKETFLDKSNAIFVFKDNTQYVAYPVKQGAFVKSITPKGFQNEDTWEHEPQWILYFTREDK